MISISINKQLFLSVILWLYSFFDIRNTLYGVKELYLSKNERKKRKKGQTFKEWFLYSRYRSEIPKYLIWLYYVVLIIHPILLISIFLAYLFVSLRNITSILTISIIIFDIFWSTLIVVLSWKPGSPWMHYERWIKKKRKVKKK